MKNTAKQILPPVTSSAVIDIHTTHTFCARETEIAQWIMRSVQFLLLVRVTDIGARARRTCLPANNSQLRVFLVDNNANSK